MIVALIPARGGSKGIKDKNLQKISGRSLVQRSIECAISAGVLEVYVSTDSEKIADEALKYGAKVLKRPNKISGDDSTTESCIDHFLKSTEFTQEDIVVLLQATSPFTDPRDLRSAISEITVHRKNTFSAVFTEMFQWRKSSNGWHENGHDRFSRESRQTYGPMVLETGNFYAFTVKNFIKYKSRFSDEVIPFQVRYESIHQIDSPEDLLLAHEIAKSNEL